MTDHDTTEAIASIESSTLAAVLRERTWARPTHPLVVCGADWLSYGAAQALSSQMARGLAALGAGKGTHVGLLLPTGTAFAVAALAVARIGAVVVPLPTFATPRELREMLVHSDVRILIATTHDYVQRLTELLDGAELDSMDRLFCAAVPQLRHVAISDGPATALCARGGTDIQRLAHTVDEALIEAMEHDVDGSDPLAIVYTPGATSAPKGVVHTHAALLGHQRDLNEIRGLTEHHVLFCDSPFFSIRGFASGLLATIVAGSTLLCSDATDPAVPIAMPESDKWNVRSMRHGLLELAETGGIALISKVSDQRRRRSCGKPAPGFETKIVDPATGVPVGAGDIGELCFRGPYLMQGYHKRGREECFDPDGWFPVGDMARIDSDGFVHLIGRRDGTSAEAPGMTGEKATALTIDQLVRDRAADAADTPVVIDPRHRLGYGELAAATEESAAALIDAGVGKGTRVALLMPNGTEWVRIALALGRIGAVLVPLSTLLRPPELRTQLRVAAVEFLITVEEFRGRRYLDDLGLTAGRDPLWDPRLPALRHVRTAEQIASAGASPRAAAIVAALSDTVTAADPLVIMFTSGSRGLPKAVVHSHGSAGGAVRSGLASRCIGVGTRLYLPMPFFWVGGFGGGVLSALLAGATLVTESIPRPETTLELLRREGVTLFRGWPDQAESLARQAETLGTAVPTLRPGSLEALLPAHLRARPGARANLFGMTESFGPYCGYPADTDMPRSAWGSCGRPFPGIEVRVTDPENGRPVRSGIVGVIQIRGPHILRGMCRRSREDVYTVDGYYETGDLGCLDDDGFLFYHGRSDDMFKVSGATVYPSEVEAALRGLDGVTHAFVTNVPGPQGDRVAAAVVCDTADTSPDRLRAAARAVLSSFKVPTVWSLLDSDADIPRGATGKVDIAGLRELLSAR